MLKLATLLFLIVQVAAPQDILPSEILDLTIRVAAVPQPVDIPVNLPWMHGAPPATEGHPPLALPLRVRIALRESEGDQFSMGDTLTCDLVLENPGDKPVTIPWSSNRFLRPETREEADAAGYREADVAFYVLDRAGHDHIVDVERVGSIPSQPSTSRTIQPGEAVAIRMSFRLRMQEEGDRAVFGDVPSGAAADVRLAAHFYLYPYGFDISENPIPVRLAPFQPQPSR
jgi:hypothetical protein